MARKSRKSSTIYAPLRAAIRAGSSEKATLEEIFTALGPRAFGLGVIVLMAPVCLPMPPGVPTVIGVILCFLAVQMVLGVKMPILPDWVKRKAIDRKKLLEAIDTLERRLHFVERIAHRRWEGLTVGLGARLSGVVFFLLGILLILPIPFLGNLPPAIAASILALALAQRDGVLMIAGLIASAAASVFTLHLAVAAFGAVSSWFN